jgi:hypothetical protein
MAADSTGDTYVGQRLGAPPGHLHRPVASIYAAALAPAAPPDALRGHFNVGAWTSPPTSNAIMPF